MTTIYRPGSLRLVGAPQPATLTIRRGWGRNNFAYRYSSMEFLVGSESDHIRFDLVLGWCMRGLRIDIRDHCCTRPTAMRRYPLNGESGPMEGGYEEGVDRARYGFELCPRELVSIGLLVRIRKGNEVLGHLLCDPQIGNGPPASSTPFFAAPLLKLK